MLPFESLLFHFDSVKSIHTNVQGGKSQSETGEVKRKPLKVAQRENRRLKEKTGHIYMELPASRMVGSHRNRRLTKSASKT